MRKEEYSQKIKNKAYELGFLFCGFSKAEFLEDEAPRLEAWLNEKRHGKMAYMTGHFDKRLDPSKLVPGAQSVISLAYNYYTDKKQSDPSAPKISTYAYGRDYHFVVKDKLRELLAYIQDEIGDVNGRVFVDSAPLLEKALAKKSGVGWIGKNSNLINPKAGSFFFLAEVVLDLELDPDEGIKDYCGRCTACIDACPTEAIYEPYQVDGSKCISYFTIELKDNSLPNGISGKMDNWMFGCDICQDVCPWNRFSKTHQEPLFEPHPELLAMSKQEWIDITEDVFRELFRKSAVKRTKFAGLKRNIRFLFPD